MTESQIKSLWQADTAEFQPMSLEEIHLQASNFSDKIRNRNLREYFAAGVVILGFGFCVWSLPSPILKIASAYTIAASLFVIWQLHHRSSKPRHAAAAEPIIGHYRSRLIQERDNLASIWRWYIGPLVPGLVLFTVGKYVEEEDITAGWIGFHIGFPILITAGIWLYNKYGSDRLQRKIDALDYASEEPK